MDTQLIKESIKKLSFNNKSDLLGFERELLSLYESEKTRRLLLKNTINSLKELYLSLAGSQSSFNIALTEGIKKEEPLYLLPFFEKLFIGFDWKEIKVNALEIFIRLCAKPIDNSDLVKLLKSGMLEDYSLDRLQALKYFYIPNLETLIDIFDQHKSDFSKSQLLLVFDILQLLYPTTLDADSAIHLAKFVKEMVPVFIQRFINQISQEEIYKKVDRFAEWFMVWRRHLLKLEENIEEGHDYYQQDFSTIIRYIPEFIWWNNGLYYSNGDKNYYFGSDGFFHLAIGGSIRNAPDRHHFTRRMAKIFVTLPFDFDQLDKDMYIYCYGKSLGAGPLLLEMLQNFMRHSPNHLELVKELGKWNPVIQKFACEEFEEIAPTDAISFMGFIYHCMRDKPDFTVQRRSIQSLLRESNVYQERIQQRANQREQAERLREERRIRNFENKVSDYWNIHDRIRPYEYKNYKIIELNSKNQLLQEGNILNHCVGSYFQKCIKRHVSIWSLRRFDNNKWFRCVTIEVFNKTQEIVQMSARFNATPTKEHNHIVESWAKREKIRGFGLV